MCIDISFLEKAYPQIIGSLLSASVAYLIFYLGSRKNTSKERKRLQEVRTLFRLSLIQFKRGLDVQIEAFENDIVVLKEDIKKQHGIFRPASVSPDASPQTVLKIDRNDVLKFFVLDRKDNKQERIDLFSMFYISLDLIEELRNRILNEEAQNVIRFRQSRKNIDHHKDKIVLKLMGEIQKVLRTDPKGIIVDPFYSKLVEHYDEHVKSKNFELDSVFVFVSGLGKMILKNEYLVHEDSLYIISLIQEGEAEFSQILIDKESQLGSYEHWLPHYKSVLKTVNRIIEIELEALSTVDEL